MRPTGVGQPVGGGSQRRGNSGGQPGQSIEQFALHAAAGNEQSHKMK